MLAVMELLPTVNVCAELHLFSVLLAVVAMLIAGQSCACVCASLSSPSIVGPAAPFNLRTRVLSDWFAAPSLKLRNLSTTICAQRYNRVVMLAVMELLPTVCAELHLFFVLLAVVVMLTAG